MKILKQNYRVVSEKGSYSLEIWLLEVLPREHALIKKNDGSGTKKLLETCPSDRRIRN